MLTGLPNRIAYDQRATQEYERWCIGRVPLTLAVLDIDKLKEVNDGYGHLAGDKVIQLTAKPVAGLLNETDFVARFGGEEFVLLLPGTSLVEAAERLEGVRQQVSRLPFRFRTTRLPITVSIGLCEFTPGMTLTDVFELADQALYRAKHNGRNRVELAGERAGTDEQIVTD